MGRLGYELEVDLQEKGLEFPWRVCNMMPEASMAFDPHQSFDLTLHLPVQRYMHCLDDYGPASTHYTSVSRQLATSAHNGLLAIGLQRRGSEVRRGELLYGPELCNHSEGEIGTMRMHIRFFRRLVVSASINKSNTNKCFAQCHLNR